MGLYKSAQEGGSHMTTANDDSKLRESKHFPHPFHLPPQSSEHISRAEQTHAVVHISRPWCDTALCFNLLGFLTGMPERDGRTVAETTEGSGRMRLIAYSLVYVQLAFLNCPGPLT